MAPSCSSGWAGSGRGPRRSPVGAFLACSALLLGTVLVGPSAAAAGGPVSRCAIEDERIPELSGLAADGERWYAVNDGGSSVVVFVLDRSCSVTRTIRGAGDPYDVEDLARAADGALWLADIGDNGLDRRTVALHRLDEDGGSTLYRMTYPDGPHDAEALLLSTDGVPHIVTKNIVGESGVYRPVSALRAPGPTRLERVGGIALTGTDTRGGPIGGTGSVTVTGGAVGADGTVVALRTYTDAYLYPAPDGDVVAALRREPVRVPLAGEPQGEAVAFEPDGTLLSASEGVGEPVRAVPGAAGRVRAAAADAADPGAAGPVAEKPAGIPAAALAAALAAAVAAAGVLLAAGRWRRGRR